MNRMVTVTRELSKDELQEIIIEHFDRLDGVDTTCLSFDWSVDQELDDVTLTMTERMNKPEPVEYETDRGVEFESEMEGVVETLKDDINKFLWTRLPPTITLDKAEEISCEVIRIIHDSWEAELAKVVQK